MPQEGLKEQFAPQFIGVNIRNDRARIQDTELARSINADLHQLPGVLIVRNGRQKQFTTALTDKYVRNLSRNRTNDRRYQIAGQGVYRNQTRVFNGLSANLITTMAQARPLNETTTYMYIADDAIMRKDDGTTFSIWGIAAPGNAPGVATTGTGLTGQYKVRYTYARVINGTISGESTPTPASTTIVLNNQGISVTGIGQSFDSFVTHVVLYRTLAGGSTFFRETSITNGTTSVTLNTADITIAGNPIQQTDNSTPPLASWCVHWKETMWLCRDAANPHYLWYSRRFRPDVFPTDQFLEIGNPDDALLCAYSAGEALLVFSRISKYRVVGSADSGFSWAESVSRRGTPSPFGVAPFMRGLAFVARDGIFVTDGSGLDIQIAEDILPLFYGQTVNGYAPINWNAATTIRLAYFKDKLFFAYPSLGNVLPDTVAVLSLKTNKWFFYQFPSPITCFLPEEDQDRLTAGDNLGFVYTLDSALGDDSTNVTMTVETKDYLGDDDSIRRKIFHFFRVDADVPPGESLTAEFFIDGIKQRSVSVTGSRTKILFALPESAVGFQWRVKFTYAGVQQIKVYGVDAVWIALEPA